MNENENWFGTEAKEKGKFERWRAASLAEGWSWLGVQYNPQSRPTRSDAPEPRFTWLSNALGDFGFGLAIVVVVAGVVLEMAIRTVLIVAMICTILGAILMIPMFMEGKGEVLLRPALLDLAMKVFEERKS